MRTHEYPHTYPHAHIHRLDAAWKVRVWRDGVRSYGPGHGPLPAEFTLAVYHDVGRESPEHTAYDACILKYAFMENVTFQPNILPWEHKTLRTFSMEEKG